MPTVSFTQNLRRHVPCPATCVPGATLRAVLDAVFAANPRVRGYVLDDQGSLRKHMAVFIDGRQIDDRVELSDPVGKDAEVFVMQALSGGQHGPHGKSRLYAATRKGLFALEHVGSGPTPWKIVQTSFLGDNVPMVLADPRDGRLYAGLNHGHFGGKIQRSENGGVSWEEIGVPAYPPVQPGEEVVDPMKKVPVPNRLELIWSLEAGHESQPGVLWCGTIPGGLFRSHDFGATWNIVRSLWNDVRRRAWFGGGADWPGIHSICVHPTLPGHVTIGVSCGGVWQTSDDGETWDCTAEGMWAAYMPPERKNDPLIQDPHRVVQCKTQPDYLWAQHHNGVFRSTDGGRFWQEVPNVPPSVFGFATVVHPRDGNTAWFVPAVSDEKRVPVDGQVVVARTRDGGKTFDSLRSGLPQEFAYDLVFRHGLDIDASGEVLAFGSTTGSIWLSEDQGDTWMTVAEHLPPIYCLRFAKE